MRFGDIRQAQSAVNGGRLAAGGVPKWNSACARMPESGVCVGNDAEQAVVTHENCCAALRQPARALMVARGVLTTIRRSCSFPACGAVSGANTRLGSRSSAESVDMDYRLACC